MKSKKIMLEKRIKAMVQRQYALANSYRVDSFDRAIANVKANAFSLCRDLLLLSTAPEAKIGVSEETISEYKEFFEDKDLGEK